MKGLRKNLLKAVAWMLVLVQFLGLGEKLVYAYSKKELVRCEQDGVRNIHINGSEVSIVNDDIKDTALKEDVDVKDGNSIVADHIHLRFRVETTCIYMS